MNTHHKLSLQFNTPPFVLFFNFILRINDEYRMWLKKKRLFKFTYIRIMRHSLISALSHFHLSFLPSHTPVLAH